MRKSIAVLILTAFLANTCVPPSYAQTVLNLPVAGTVVNLSQAFSPVMIKGINVHPENAMMFDFIVDPGQSGLGKDTVGAEATKLIKYFMAALAVPEDDLWVNLSPYENDRIVPEALGQTEMGRDMLAQDYLLKQITASLIDPQNKVGKEFWDSVYKESYAKYGTTDIPVDTFNKVWIMPAKAVVYENKGQALVVESSLKVMLEFDYLAMENNGVGAALGRPQQDQDLAKEVLRSVVLPVLEKEVNAGRNFAQLRQVYNALVLAHWFRVNFKKSVLHKVYADRSRIKGVDVDDKQIAQKIYSQYVDSFKKGVYNYVKEEYDPFTQELIPRKYFSGGETFNRAALDAAMTTTSDASQADQFSREMDSRGLVVTASFSGIPVVAPAVNEYRLSSGRPVVTRIPADTWKRFGNGKEGFQVVGQRLFDNFPWVSTRASYRKVDMDFEVTAGILDLYHQGRGRSGNDPITILSWGCGEGVELTGLMDIVNILKRKYRDINVRVVGYSRDFYPAWSEVPSEVDMIVDDQKDLMGGLAHLGIKKLDIVFSRLGFTHFLSSQKEDALKHLEDLGRLLGRDGEMRIDIHGVLTDRQYAELGLKSAGMVRVTSSYGLRVERIVSKDNAETSGPDDSRSRVQDIVNGLIYAGFAGIGIRPVVDALVVNTDVSFRRVLFLGGVFTFAALAWLWEHKKMKKPGLLRDRKALRESIQKTLTGLPYSSAYSSIVKAGIAVQDRLSDGTPAGGAIVALADLLQERGPDNPLVQWDATSFSDLSGEEQQLVAALDSPFVFEGDMSTSMRLAELQWEAAEAGEEFQDFVDAVKRLRAEKIDRVDKAEAQGIVRNWGMGIPFNLRQDERGFPIVSMSDFKVWEEANAKASQTTVYLSHDGRYVLKMPQTKLSDIDDFVVMSIIPTTQLLVNQLEESGYDGPIKAVIPRLVRVAGQGFGLLLPKIDGLILSQVPVNGNFTSENKERLIREVERFEELADRIAGPVFDLRGTDDKRDLANFIYESSTGSIINIDMINIDFLKNRVIFSFVWRILGEFKGQSVKNTDMFSRRAVTREEVMFLGQVMELNKRKTGEKAVRNLEKARRALNIIFQYGVDLNISFLAEETLRSFDRAQAGPGLVLKDKPMDNAETIIDLDDYAPADPIILSHAGQSTIYFSKDEKGGPNGDLVLKVFDARMPVFNTRRDMDITDEHVIALAGVIEQVHNMLIKQGNPEDVTLEVPKVVRIKGGGLALLSRRIYGEAPSIHHLAGGDPISVYISFMIRMSGFLKQVRDFTGGLEDDRRDGENFLNELGTGKFYNIDPINMNMLAERMGFIKVRDVLNRVHGINEELSLFNDPVDVSIPDIKTLEDALDTKPLLAKEAADALKAVYILEPENEQIRRAAFGALKGASLRGHAEARRVIGELIPVAEEEMTDGKDMPMVYNILETATSISDPRAFEVVGRRLDHIRRFLSSGVVRRNLRMQGMIIKTLEQSALAVPAAGKLLKEFQGDNAEAHVEGGIDFKSKNMNVDVKGEGIDFQLPEEMRGMDLDNIEGLTPVIMNIIPVQNMSAYLSAS